MATIINPKDPLNPIEIDIKTPEDRARAIRISQGLSDTLPGEPEPTFAEFQEALRRGPEEPKKQ